MEINDDVYIYLSGKYAYIKYKCKKKKGVQ